MDNWDALMIHGSASTHVQKRTKDCQRVAAGGSMKCKYIRGEEGGEAHGSIRGERHPSAEIYEQDRREKREGMGGRESRSIFSLHCIFGNLSISTEWLESLQWRPSWGLNREVPSMALSLVSQRSVHMHLARGHRPHHGVPTMARVTA